MKKKILKILAIIGISIWVFISLHSFLTEKPTLEECVEYDMTQGMRCLP